MNPMQFAKALAPAVIQRARALRLPQTAASLAYLSLLAIVPVFTIAVSLLGALPMLDSLREALLQFLASNLFLPKFSATIVHYLNQFADKASQLSVIGALIFFASALSALVTIENALNRIWRVERPRSLVRRLTMYWMFLTLAPLILAGSVAVNGVIASEVFGAARLRSVERAWLELLPWVITIGTLTLLYRLAPNASVRWRDAFAGSLAAAVGLEVLKAVLGVQLGKISTYTLVYGTFALLPAFLMWLFLLWWMVLSGGVLAASLPGVLDGAGAAPQTPAARFELAAKVLRRLAARRETLRAKEFRAVFSANTDLAAATARMLAELGYLDRFWRAGEGSADSESGLWDEYWRLAPSAYGMTLRPLFEQLWGHDAPLLDTAQLDGALSADAAAPESA